MRLGCSGVSRHNEIQSCLTRFVFNQPISFTPCKGRRGNFLHWIYVRFDFQYFTNVFKENISERRNKYKIKEHEELELLKYELGYEFREVKEMVYFQLDNIVQSSAMVENINSILRMYLNTTKNHVTQSMLNLFMHYHNHRRYVADKRKGKTPIEILTERNQKKDWLELFLERVPWEQSDFLVKD